MIANVKIPINANVKIFKNGILERQSKNLVVALGQEWIAERMISDTPALMAGIALGDDNGLGVELITNQDMELDSDWSNYGTPTTNEQSNEQAHAGTYSRKMVLPGTTFDGIQGAVFTTVAMQGIKASVWVYPVGTTTIHTAIRQGDNADWIHYQKHIGLTADAWNKLEFNALDRVGGVSAYMAFFSDTAGTIYIDDVSAKLTTAMADAALVSETNRKALTSSVRTGNYIDYTADWIAGEATGPIEECALLNDAVAGGTMLARTGFDVVNKGAADSISVVWRITLNAV